MFFFTLAWANLNAIDIIGLINSIITTLLGAFLVFRTVYIVVGLFVKQKYKDAKVQHKYAFLISARNESEVIGQLIDSIWKQNYPREKLTIFVVADNCTDNTAQICIGKGCVVYERFNDKQIGKGYALKFLTEHINEDYGMESFDGFFVFDADNLLSENYVLEMNKAFDEGNKIITSYRNVKNFDQSAISACYGYHQYRNMRTLHIPRSKMNFSCTVTGTGFLVASEILKDGWKWELITEDAEFSVDSVLDGYQIVYCHDAVFYDEQPTNVKTMFRQRLRWAKGGLLVFLTHAKKLLKAMFTSEKKLQKNAKGHTNQTNFQRKFAYYDLFWQLFPTALILFFWHVLYYGALIVAYIVIGTNVVTSLLGVLYAFLYSLLQLYSVTIIQVIPVIICEWKRMVCNPFMKVVYLFLFPLFDLLNIPISFVAIFMKVEWKPIKHNASISIDQINEDDIKYNKKSKNNKKIEAPSSAGKAVVAENAHDQ